MQCLAKVSQQSLPLVVVRHGHKILVLDSFEFCFAFSCFVTLLCCSLKKNIFSFFFVNYALFSVLVLTMPDLPFLSAGSSAVHNCSHWCLISPCVYLLSCFSSSVCQFSFSTEPVCFTMSSGCLFLSSLHFELLVSWMSHFETLFL